MFDLQKKVEETDFSQEIKLSEIAIGTIIEVKTENSTYLLEKAEQGFIITGGKRWKNKSEVVNIHGCTFGGSAIKLRTLFIEGYMEFNNNERTWTTSAIKELNIHKK